MDLKSLTFDDINGLADNRRVFENGQDYARSGAIYQFSVTPTGITARVHGNYGDYTVTVSHSLKLHCTCPYEGQVCKHLIAVLLRYLRRDTSADSPAQAQVPSALEQTLAAMPPDDLRALILRLAREQPDVRRVLLETVPIAPALLRQQPHDPAQVKRLKKAIHQAVTEPTGDEEEYYDRYDEGLSPDFTEVLEAALMLHPDDQTEVYWHIVSQCSKNMEEYNLSTEAIEQALMLYAEAVARQELPPEGKHYYFDTLIGSLGWTMCGYSGVTETIKEALDAIATVPEDYEYLIGKLKKSKEDDAQDWVIGYYKALGDEARYLEARQAALHTEANYLELADFWKAKGDEAQWQATLEAWVTRLDETKDREVFPFFRPDPATGHGQVVRLLAAFYTAQGDEANLCRILTAQARREGVTLELYQRLHSLAGPLGTWGELRPELLRRTRGETRARLYLYEQDWERAIEYARLSAADDATRAVVADGVQEHHPQEAIELYQTLIQTAIGRGSRDGYRVAAHYAGKAKEIYTAVLKDKEGGEQFIADIRKTHSRRPALQDEFRGL